MGGVSAAVSKTAAAPIERVKLLIQNQVWHQFFVHTGLPLPPVYSSFSGSFLEDELVSHYALQILSFDSSQYKVSLIQGC